MGKIIELLQEFFIYTLQHCFYSYETVTFRCSSITLPIFQSSGGRWLAKLVCHFSSHRNTLLPSVGTTDLNAIMREKYARCRQCTSKNPRAYMHVCINTKHLFRWRGGPGNNDSIQLHLMATFNLWQRSTLMIKYVKGGSRKKGDLVHMAKGESLPSNVKCGKHSF